MPAPVNGDEADNVIRLDFATRPVAPHPQSVPPFLLEARSDGWKLHTGGRLLDAQDLADAADLLRDVARSLTEQARRAAGQRVERCIAEFVLYETGGIDHWVAEDADRNRLRIGLRTALGTIREP